VLNLDLHGNGKNIIMKQRFIISLLGYITGISLTLISLFPWQYEQWIPDIFGILGFCLIIAFLTYGIFMVNKKKNLGGDLLTSRLMPIYKYYMPLLVMTVLLFNSLLLVFKVYPGHDISIFIVFEVMLCITILFLWPCLKLRSVYLDKNKLIATDFVNSLVIKVSEVKTIRRSFIVFYLLKLKDDSSGFKLFTILPKIEESSNLFVTPRSIKLLKNKLKN